MTDRRDLIQRRALGDSMPARFGLLVLSLLLLSFTVCTRRSPAAARSAAPVYFDFLANFPSARIEPDPAADGEPRARLYDFVRDRIYKRSLVTIAESRVRFLLPAIPPAAELRGYVGMPFNLGDGALAELSLVQEGRTHLLLSRYMDPARRRVDRNWIPITVDLAPFAGRPAEIVFSARSPSGDLIGDWIGWAEPVVGQRD